MLQLPARWRTAAHAKNAIASQLKRRYFLRAHALALFAWTFAIGYLVSKLSFAAGIQTLSIRYFVTGISAYLGFLLGVRIWLWFVEAHNGRNNVDLDAGDMLDLTDASFDIANMSSEGAGDILGGVGDGIGAAAGDGCLPILVIGIVVIIAAMLFAFVGPELLVEIAFEAVLAGSLVGAMRLGREPDWLWTVFRKTVWTFLILILLMMMFGKYAQKHYPEAKTTKEVIHQIMQQNELRSNKK